MAEDKASLCCKPTVSCRGGYFGYVVRDDDTVMLKSWEKVDQFGELLSE